MSLGDILIVDDVAENLEILSSILTQAGYRVRSANRGGLALRVCSRKPPELLLLDINLPDLNGYEVCARLKADPATSALPVIFVSALDDALDKVRAFEVGGVDYVVKPFHKDEVVARIRSQLEIHRLRSQLEQTNRHLQRKNLELLRAQRKVESVFTALSQVLPGTIIDDKYQIDDQIGTGGFGAVFRATHLDLGLQVAVKIFQPVSRAVHEESFERFRHEGISACRVRHPNAVQVLDSGVSDRGIAYLVMELLDGASLRRLLERRERLELAHALEIALPVAEVLEVAEDAGLVHRDIKPENIYLHRDGKKQVVKVVDFGIAKLIEDEERLGREERRREAREGQDAPAPAERDYRTTGLIGTPHYIAPERLLESTYDARSDIYSLGVCLYEMLAGRLPYDSPSGSKGLHVLARIFHSPPTPLREAAPDVPEAVADLVMQTIAHEPEIRPSAAELVESLQELAASQASGRGLQLDLDELAAGASPDDGQAMTQIAPTEELQPSL